MLQRPIFKERYPKGTFHTIQNIYELSKNPSPEAMAIVYQNLNDYGSDFGSFLIEENRLETDFLECLKKNIFLITNSKEIVMIDYESESESEKKNVNLYLWEEYKKILDETKDWSLFKYNTNFMKNLLTIPCALEIVKKIYSHNDIFNDTRNMCNFVSNWNSDQLLLHYNYDISNASRYILDQILLEPHLIYLVYTWYYNEMYNSNWIFKEELIAKVFNPKRLLQICETYSIEFDELMEIY